MATPSILTTSNAAVTAGRSPAVTFSGVTVQENDVVAFSVLSAATGGAITLPSGWVNVLGGTTVVASDSHTQALVYHKVTSAEAAGNTLTYTATNLWNANVTGNVLAHLIRDVDPTTPVDDAASTFNSGNTITPHVLAGLATGANLGTGSLVYSVVTKDATPATWTTPTGWTAQSTTTVNSTGQAAFTRDTLTSAGTAVAAQNITPNAGDEYTSITVAWTPTSGSSPQTWTGSTATVGVAGQSGSFSQSGGSGITVTSRGANDSGITDVASVSLSAFTPAADELLIVAAAIEENVTGGSAASTVNTPTGLPAGAAAFVPIGTDVEPAATDYQDAAGMWYSQLGSTPAATTISQNGTSQGGTAWLALAAVTVSGHNTAAPLAQAAIKDQEYSAPGSAPALSVAFGSDLTAQNVVIAAVAQSVDAGETGAPSPTVGGQSMGTAVATVGANQYMQVAIFARTVAAGEEAGRTVAVAASGGSTRYMHVVFAAELAKASGGGSPQTWSGSTATVGVAGQSGSFTQDGAPQTWTGSTASVGVAGQSGSFSQSGGTQTWTGSTATVGVSGVSGIFASGTFPLAVSGNGRYVLNRVGGAWPMIGDAGWGAIANLTNAEQITYLDALQGYGINLVMVSLIEGHYSNNPNGDVLGNQAYTGTMFQSTPGAAYWARVDTFVAAAAARGITLLAFPAYLGYATDGLAAEVNAATNAQMTAYGEFLGQRYAGAPNIIWCGGGDRGDNLTATDLARTDAMMTGIRTRAPGHLMTAHTDDLNTADDLYGSYSWLDINNAYKADRVPKPQLEAAWAENVGPVFYIEGQYEQDPQRSPVLANGDRMLRVQTWIGFTAGGFGHIFGNDPRWFFGHTWGGPYGGGTWQESLADAVGNRELGTLHFSRFASFIQSVSGWESTVPDTTDTFLTAGESTGETAAAARFSTSKAIVYTVTTGSITLDLTELSAAASVRVRRFDPTSGAYSEVGTYATTGPQTIAHPGNNAFGHTDWVYLIEPALVWAGSTGTIGVAGQSGAFVPGATTWVGSTATAGAAGQSGSFVPGEITWTGSTASAGAAGQSGAFTPGTATWVGSDATIGVSAASGPWSVGGGPQTWSGSTATVGVAGQSAAFDPGATTWVGSTATVGASAQSGTFTSEITWVGNTGTIGVTTQSGTFAAGEVTWVGSTATVGATAQTGSFTSEVTWIGSIATAGAAGQSGVFVPGATTWPGSIATIGVTALTGIWSTEGGPQTWPGSVATIGVAAQTGPFVPGGVSWSGSTATASAAAQSGVFVPGDVTWIGSIGTAGVTAQSGSWTAGAGSQTWAGSVASIGVTGQSGVFVPGATTWVGSTGSIGLSAVSGSFDGALDWLGSQTSIGVAGQSGLFVPGPVSWAGTTTTLGANAQSGMWFISADLPPHFTGWWGDKAVVEMFWNGSLVMDYYLEPAVG
jgi:hypothetical protein